ncbi:MAG: ABC transporter permease [Peptococcaceae bacterium]|nr:ABC transporter permease [Peptococcaceae bacterium]
MKKLLLLLIGLIIPCLLVGLWVLADHMNWLNTLMFPSPQAVWSMFVSMLADGSLGRHMSASFFRLGSGFLMALCLAIPLGFLLGQIRFLRRLLMPTLAFFQQIPPIAWIPFFILWLGFEEPAKIAVITYSAFAPIFLNTVQGVQSLDPLLRETAHSFRLSRWQMIWRVNVPSAAGPLFVGFRLGLSNSWRALVGAELIQKSSGIGGLIAEGRQYSQPDKIFLAIFIIGLAGALLDNVLRYLEKRLMPWQAAGGRS